MRTVFDFLAAVLVLGTVVLVAFAWPTAPERIPHHFDAAGNADGWGSRGTLLIFPLLACLVFALLSLLERHPERLNLPFVPSAGATPRLQAYGRDLVAGLKLTMAAMFFYLSVAVLMVAHGRWDGIGSWFVPALLISLLVQIAFHTIRMSRIARR